jgi:hypothetical protein
MRNPTCDTHFVAKALKQSFVAGSFVGQKFHRHSLAERQVVGAINLTHSTFAQQRNDAIAPGNQTSREEAAFIQEKLGGTGGV